MTREEFEKKLELYGIAGTDKEFLKLALDFAQSIHKEEKRLSGEEYITHPMAVALKLARIKMDIPTIAAGLLHDCAENEPSALKEIRKRFGEEVSFLVDGVTKVDRVKATGVDRALESVKKMFLALAEDIRVVIIKLMDRLHNMETAQWLPEEKQKRIAEETLMLYASLAERLGMWNVKAELEDLSMKILYPKEYENIYAELKKRAPEQERRLKKIIVQVKNEFAKENIKIIDINYRTKHVYSVWRKLYRYEGDWSRLSDLIAIRIIVTDVKNCYAALGVIHKLWKPVPGRFKDYIALPKPNGYKSLHTTVFTGEKIIIEFQIRSEEMHKEAEAGIAAHWAYSEAGKPRELKKIGKKFNWIFQLQEWQRELKKENISSEELLEALKIDFFKDRIFTLTPRGDVIDLPRGATPLDFAYHIHSEIGNHAVGARVNGKLVSFLVELKSGDTVEIITQKGKRPTSEWLSLAKTGLAKNRIKKALRMNPKNNFMLPDIKVVEMKVYGKNRVGFIKDISSIFSKNKINIQNLISARGGNEEVPIKITFAQKNAGEPEKIKKKIEKIEGVKKVTYSFKS